MKKHQTILKPFMRPAVPLMQKMLPTLAGFAVFFWTFQGASPEVFAKENVMSLRHAKLEIGGELELEIIDSQSNGRSFNPGGTGQLNEKNNPYPRMSIDKIVITPRVHVTDDILFQADIEFGPDKPVKLDEAWVKFLNLPGNSWVTIGQEDPFMHVSRKTESYPILGYAFWQDEDLGIFTGGQTELFYWRFSVTNGRRLKDRQAGEDKVYPIPSDDDDNGEGNSNKQVGIGIGLNHDFKEGHNIDIFPFWYTGELSESDISYLNGISTYADTSNKDQTRSGISLDYTVDVFNFFAQYMMGKDGVMDRDGWYVQPSYKQKIDMNRLKSVEFLLRYEEYNVDLVRDVADARTWDRQALTLAVISEIVKGFKVKTEYYLNEEDTGGASVANNEFLLQAEVKF